MKKSDPPKDLSAEARTLWRRVCNDFEITDAAGLHLLHTALQAFDRMRQAQAVIAAEGVCQRDRFGQARAHPACQVERDSRAGMLAALKALNLDLEPLRDGVGRPPGAH